MGHNLTHVPNGSPEGAALAWHRSLSVSRCHRCVVVNSKVCAFVRNDCLSHFDVMMIIFNEVTDFKIQFHMIQKCF